MTPRRNRHSVLGALATAAGGGAFALARFVAAGLPSLAADGRSRKRRKKEKKGKGRGRRGEGGKKAKKGK